MHTVSLIILANWLARFIDRASSRTLGGGRNESKGYRFSSIIDRVNRKREIRSKRFLNRRNPRIADENRIACSSAYSHAIPLSEPPLYRAYSFYLHHERFLAFLPFFFPLLHPTKSTSFVIIYDDDNNNNNNNNKQQQNRR